jgi:hypothetical protein
MGRIRISAVGLLGLIAAAPSWAASCDLGRAPAVPVIKNLPYAQARALVLAGGWAPVPGTPHNELSDNETSFRDRGFAELQFCRMSDDSLCRFEFRAPSGILLWVTTSGDENPVLSSAAVVRAAKLSCADGPDPG